MVGPYVKVSKNMDVCGCVGVLHGPPNTSPLKTLRPDVRGPKNMVVRAYTVAFLVPTLTLPSMVGPYVKVSKSMDVCGCVGVLHCPPNTSPLKTLRPDVRGPKNMVIRAYTVAFLVPTLTLPSMVGPYVKVSKSMDVCACVGVLHGPPNTSPDLRQWWALL
jgi:hypothetical protein